MRFEQPLLEVEFLKRYKRFFGDIEVKGKTEVAHVPNTGSMKTLVEEPAQALVQFKDDPKRKLHYTLEALKKGKTWVGVNTSNPNKLIKEIFETKARQTWSKFDTFFSEVKINDHTRLDALMVHSHQITEKPKPDGIYSRAWSGRFIEVKNVTLAREEVAQFPDSVSERAQKHLEELVKLKEHGHEVEVVFAVQRDDCVSFSPADDIDPKYGKALREAKKTGVIISALEFKVSSQSIQFSGKELEVIL